LLDSVHIEELGVPTVTFVTSPFESAARTLARIHGIPDIPLIIVSDDYLENSDEVIRERTRDSLEEILAALFGTPTS
jgi:vacuolar-type H+-ATPase subunit F/Vma7